MWRLCLLSEAGQNFKYEGSLTSQSENDPLGIASEELRIILSMPELAAFDGKVSEGQLSGKADGQRPSEHATVCEGVQSLYAPTR